MTVLLLSQWVGAGVRVSDRSGRGRDCLAEAAQTEERVVLDLHASGDYQSGGRWLRMNSELTLQPGECVRIRTSEQVRLPRSVIGLIVSRVSLAADGLNVATVKVDPQFLGQAEVAVTNASLRTIRVHEDDAFASLMILQLDQEVTEDLPRLVTPTKSLETPRWGQRVRRLAPFVATGIVTLIAASAPELVKLVFGG